MPHSILIVDDERLAINNISEFLTDNGYASKAATSKQECTALLTGGYQPQAALIDIKLGEGQPDGVETAEEVVRRFNIPVIFISGYTDAATLSRIKGVPSYGCIQKCPGNEQFMLTAIAQAIELHEKERALRESEERYRTCFENAPIGVFRSTPEGRFIEVNQALAEILGYTSPREVLDNVGDIAEEIYVESSRRTQLVQQTLESPKTLHFENVYRRRDGSLFTANLYLKAIKDEAGEPLYLEGMVEDVTERREIEDQLQTKHRLLETLLENTSDMIIRTDLEQRHLYANPQFYRHTGLSPEEFLGRTNEELGVPPELARSLYEVGEAAYYRRTPQKTSFHFETVDMGRRWFQANTCPEFNNEGEVVSLLHFIRDITELQNAQERLSEREAQLRSIFSAMHEGVLVYSSTEELLFSNDRAREILGGDREALDAAALRRMNLSRLREDGSKVPVKESPWNYTLRTGEAQRHMQLEVEREDGRHIWISVNSKPLCPQEGRNLAGVVVSFRDITREREREEQLRELAEEREHMLMEINHRVKNNLYTVEALANIERNEEHKDKEEALLDIIGRIRAISLVHRKLYSTGEFDAVDIRAYLQDLVQTIISANAMSKHQCTLHFASESIPLSPKKITALGLIISELITNTLKHAQKPEETEIQLTIRREQEAVKVDYRDTGGGLGTGIESIEDLQAGTGMRLVKMLVSDLEGSISIPAEEERSAESSAEGAEEKPPGAVFHIRFVP